MSDSLPLKKFYVLRHAETVDNKSDVVSGAVSQTGLTKEGVAQAESTRELLVKLENPITRVVTSEMQRTKDTADITCDNKLPRSVNIGFNERVAGDAEGRSKQEVDAIKATNNGEVPNQEKKDCFRNRVVSAVGNELKKDGIPLFITHGGGGLRILENVLQVDEAKQFGRFPNCVLHEFVPPTREGEKWKVNVLTLNENKEIKRRPFGAVASVVDKVAGGEKSGREIK